MTKERDGHIAFKSWLRKSMMTLQHEKAVSRKQKINKKDEKRKKSIRDKKNKILSEIAYKEWTQQKKEKKIQDLRIKRKQ